MKITEPRTFTKYYQYTCGLPTDDEIDEYLKFSQNLNDWIEGWDFARDEKDFELSDEIRKFLNGHGIKLSVDKEGLVTWEVDPDHKSEKAYRIYFAIEFALKVQDGIYLNKTRRMLEYYVRKHDKDPEKKEAVELAKFAHHALDGRFKKLESLVSDPFDKREGLQQLYYYPKKGG
jgi:hypothetical protein